MHDKAKSVSEGGFALEFGQHAKRALEDLRDLGCDPTELRRLFGWLAEDEIELTVPRLRAGERVPGRLKLNLRTLDLRAAAHKGLRLKDFASIAERARRLSKDVIRLRKTALVGHLIDHGMIKKGDLLAGSPFHFHNGSAPFSGLLLLFKIARQIGPQKRPEYCSARKQIHRYIRENTRHWRDRLFADIYNDLFPNDQTDEKRVEGWRRRHGLTH